MFGTQTLGLCVYLPPLSPPLPPDSAARYYTNVCVDINVHGTICEYQNQWQNYSTSGVFNMPPQWLESEGGGNVCIGLVNTSSGGGRGRDRGWNVHLGIGYSDGSLAIG